MSRLCLDTSAYSHFRRDHPEAVRLIRSATEVLMPVITLGELRTGFRLGDRPAPNEARLSAFLSESVVRIVDVDDAASILYAELGADLRRRGVPVPSNDLWIASLALREGATVLTFDDHFRGMARVGVLILKP